MFLGSWRAEEIWRWLRLYNSDKKSSVLIIDYDWTMFYQYMIPLKLKRSQSSQKKWWFVLIIHFDIRWNRRKKCIIPWKTLFVKEIFPYNPGQIGTELLVSFSPVWPRSLDQFYIITYCMKWVKSSYTDSVCVSFSGDVETHL